MTDIELEAERLLNLFNGNADHALKCAQELFNTDTDIDKWAEVIYELEQL